MNKYKVAVQTLYWYSEVYLVEAESEEDINEELILDEGELIDSEMDALDQINSIDSIELIQDNEYED